MIDFNEPIYVENGMNYIRKAIENKKICGDGEYTKKCNAWLEEKTGTRKAMLTTSCTHATELAAILTDIKPGDEDIIDPETNKSLGKLEYIVGIGKVTNVQEHMCVLESCEYAKGHTKKIVKRTNGLLGAMNPWGDGSVTEETVEPPEWMEFCNPQIKQLARLVK